MFVSRRADGTNGAALWIYYAARPPPSPPVTLSLSSRLSLFVSFSTWSPYDFLPGRVLSFTRVIPLIPFLPLLSGSFHFQQRVLSISSYSSDVTRGLPLTASCDTHTLVRLLFCPSLCPRLCFVRLQTLCHIFSMFMNQTSSWTAWRLHSRGLCLLWLSCKCNQTRHHLKSQTHITGFQIELQD